MKLFVKMLFVVQIWISNTILQQNHQEQKQNKNTKIKAYFLIYFKTVCPKTGHFHIGKKKLCKKPVLNNFLTANSNKKGSSK